jgi:hypothetical protein
MTWTPKEIKPARALLHPVWIGAVTLLVLNDHLFKASELSGWWTGKASDFAGLLIAPALLATLCRVRTHRGFALSSLAVAIVFSTINLIPVFAHTWDLLLTPFWGFHTTVDPTDLLALPMLALGWWVFVPTMESKRSKEHPILQKALFAFGITACLASSPPPDCTDFNCQSQDQSQVSLLNRTNELHVFRIRYLRPEVTVDCEIISENPGAYLNPDIFGSAITWRVMSGQEIAIDPDRARFEIEPPFEFPEPEVLPPARNCQASLIQSDTAPDIVVFWDIDRQFKTFAFDADIPREIAIDPGTLSLEANYDLTEGDRNSWRFRPENCPGEANFCDNTALERAARIPTGAQYHWTSLEEDAALFAFPTSDSLNQTQPDETCNYTGNESALAWDNTNGRYRITSIDEGRDGCHYLALTTEVDTPSGWWLCAPIDALTPLIPTEGIEIEVNIDRNYTSSQASGLRIDVSHHQGGDIVAQMTLYLVRGTAIPSELSVDLEASRIEGCTGRLSPCGEVEIPQRMVSRQAGGTETVSPGQTVELGTGLFRRNVTLVRAVYKAVSSQSCNANENATSAQAGPYVEAIVTLYTP